MIKRYTYGRPFPTEVIVQEVIETETELTAIYRDQSDGSFCYQLEESDAVYGLGEQVRGMNKRGWIYRSNCTDNPNQCETREELYAAHNYLVIQGERTLGIYLDTPTIVTYDVGYTKANQLKISLEDGENLVLYILEGESLVAVNKEFRQLIGPSYLPPRWAFGMGQSRWGYKTEEDIREVVRGYRENQIPLDSVYMDIDYMDNYKDFTVNEERFRNLKNFTAEMKAAHIHLVPIIDAGVKIEEGYPVYEEGVANNYFCKNQEGEDFVAAVWPGKVHFPDFLNPEVRDWFGRWYHVLLEAGIEGFWNDMNEPAIFYSEKHLEEVFTQIAEYKGKNLDIESFFQLKDLVTGISNRSEDYQSFYHNSMAGRVCHDQVHNLYGYNMTRAASDAIEQMKPETRVLLFSRASMIGMHRYGGIWTGDNSAWWGHLLLNIKQMPALNMCGFLYTGADIGGFGSNTTEDLLMRWLEYGIFTPLMRNHSALGSREQEPYQFMKKKDFAHIIGLRYFFMPYIYSEYMKAALTNEQYFYSLAMLFPSDIRAIEIEDQLFVGHHLMIAPVHEQNATGRYVYLPEDMKCVRFRSAEDFDEEILDAGDHYLSVKLNEVLVFIRKNSLIPVAQAAQCMEEVDFEKVNLLSYAEATAAYSYYTDNGVDRNVNLEDHIRELTANGDSHVNSENN